MPDLPPPLAHPRDGLDIRRDIPFASIRGSTTITIAIRIRAGTGRQLALLDIQKSGLGKRKRCILLPSRATMDIESERSFQKVLKPVSGH